MKSSSGGGSKSLLSGPQRGVQEDLGNLLQQYLGTQAGPNFPGFGGLSNQQILPGSLASSSILATRLFRPTRYQGKLRKNNMTPYRPFGGADDALSRLLSGQSGATIGQNEMLATAQDTIVNPLKLSINQLLEEQTPAIQQAASAGGTRFSSRVGNVLGDLLQDANRQATTVIGSELGRLEQTRLLANQAAQLQAEGLQVQGLGLARDRENQAFNRNAAALQNEEMFRQLRQQRIQSTLPHFNPLLGSALQFSTAPTQQYVQGSSSGGIGGALGGFLGGNILGNEAGGFLGAGLPGFLPGNVGGVIGGLGGFFG